MGLNITPYSPLRYPGGKNRLAPFLSWVIHQNDLYEGVYVEPYAGGAGVALYLLCEQFVHTIHINDIDPLVYSFWHSILNETDKIIRLINDTPVTLETWSKQRQIFLNPEEFSSLERGFAAFFLNRTNYSGILRGGVIGGQQQQGKYKIDARYITAKLIRRIESIALMRNRIRLHNCDAISLLNTLLPRLPTNTLIYLDPPYYEKGQELYRNFYTHQDHEQIAQVLHQIQRHWILSYDNVPPINNLYNQYRRLNYDLRYTARIKYHGSETIIFSPNVQIPNIEYPLDMNPPSRYYQDTLSI